MSKSKRIIEITTPLQLERTVHDLISQGYDVTSIISLLSDSSRYLIVKQIADDLEEIASCVSRICAEYKPYEDIRLILENDLVMPTNRKSWYLHIIDKNIVLPKAPESTKILFASKHLYLKRSYQVPVSYNPHLPIGIYTENDVKMFNLYKPPSWKEKLQKLGTYEQMLQAPTAPIPPLYDKFLNHLCDKDEESINVILDWISISLVSRNRTYLTTIGSQGIGKGILCKVIAELHGVHNSSNLPFESISKQFNKQFADKTFIYLDEVKKATDEQINKLKKQNDEQMEVELKGIDSEVIANYSNLIVSSNYLDSLRIDPDDRRFTVPNLTSGRLEFAMTKSEISSLLAPENIEQFALHLITRKYDENLINFPYKSTNALRLLNASAFEWEKWFVDEFCKDYASQTISARSACEQALLKFKRYNITSASLDLLSKKFKGIFIVKKTNEYKEFDGLGTLIDCDKSKRVNCIVILPLDKQKTYDIVEKED